ncbi:hypothetical protein CDL15_Pgr004788 [Punica granatum]|uniref:Uncharacterized protein n=1 Tax=Punica granatum TaxID=22663 RepID=A0A218W6P1_PUNGR|nr:hypothetical protein CDL15_Pgr004788 [Punica granatum]
MAKLAKILAELLRAELHDADLRSNDFWLTLELVAAQAIKGRSSTPMLQRSPQKQSSYVESEGGSKKRRSLFSGNKKEAEIKFVKPELLNKRRVVKIPNSVVEEGAGK